MSDRPVLQPLDILFLIDLAKRLMHVPVMYGIDQGDVERLEAIAYNEPRKGSE